MGLQIDPIQVCGFPFPISLEQLLASILVKDDSGLSLGFRATFSTPLVPCDCNPLIDCDNNGNSPETYLPLGFGLDDCGKLAIRFVVCDGTLPEREQE
jgi:hypothetical protein